jgi:hypothetical protein
MLHRGWTVLTLGSCSGHGVRMFACCSLYHASRDFVVSRSSVLTRLNLFGVISEIILPWNKRNSLISGNIIKINLFYKIKEKRG